MIDLYTHNLATIRNFPHLSQLYGFNCIKSYTIVQLCYFTCCTTRQKVDIYTCGKGHILAGKWWVYREIITIYNLLCFEKYLLQLGNPETSDAEDWRGLVDYAWSHAVVSDETHRTIKESCDFDSNDTWSNKDCNEAVNEVLKQYKEIDIYSLYTSVCNGDTASSIVDTTQVVMKRSSKMVCDNSKTNLPNFPVEK